MGQYIASETLAVELCAGAPPAGSHVESFELEGQEVTISVKRAG